MFKSVLLKPYYEKAANLHAKDTADCFKLNTQNHIITYWTYKWSDKDVQW